MTQQPSAALINAVLAMDVYNRGVNPALVVNFERIGNYELIAGSVTSTADNFEAATYQLAGDPSTRIISFRGTDSVADVPAWLGGAGLTGWPTQFPDAEAYYKTWATTSNVSLTGHSLGGGLAGYIAALNDKPAYAFDAMPFEFAAEVRYDQLHGFWGALTSNPIPRYSDIHMVSVSGEVLQYVRDAAPIVEAPLALLQLGPVDGAIAIAHAAVGIASESDSVLGSGTNLGLDPVSLHSIALLTMMQWASDNGLSDWKQAAAALLAPLQDDAIASAVGIPGASATAGEGSPSAKMKDMIAYSTVTDASGYGNSAVQALFYGGDVLGDAVGASSAAGYLKASGVQAAFADVVVEYSALLAQNHDEVTGATPGVIGHEHGVIYNDTAANLLVADFSPDLWLRADTGTTVDVIGKMALIDAIATGDGANAGLIDSAITTLWGGQTGNLDWLSAALSDAATTIALDALPGVTVAASAGALLVAGAGNDTLLGTGNNDLLIGGGGSDKLDGGAGNNILVGGANAFYFYQSGDGSDVIINGTASVSTPTGTLDFSNAATAGSLWFVKSGNDLQIDLLGTHQQVTVADWFLGGSYQLREIKAGGLEIDANAAAQLAQAMSAYAQSHPGFDPTVASQMPSDAQWHEIIAGAWHINA
ncbi:Mbeg1-like protein [Bradyrhizobium sp. SZCCHNR1075]|uniref:Mbeg1-like protein n=1 Tax=Bradyrhizobium sp. SZCCHNR1075 TaxID=3057362 RepID=UPI0028EA7F2A|nr:Mbeg1-like protein [Bradyrhizobium sp. SZCCHNR1075]